jgi:hypothetical protein
MFIFFLSVLSCICHMGVIGSCTVEDCILASYLLNTPINSFVKIGNQSRVSVFKAKFTTNFQSKSLVVEFCK